MKKSVKFSVNMKAANHLSIHSLESSKYIHCTILLSHVLDMSLWLEATNMEDSKAFLDPTLLFWVIALVCSSPEVVEFNSHYNSIICEDCKRASHDSSNGV